VKEGKMKNKLLKLGCLSSALFLGAAFSAGNALACDENQKDKSYDDMNIREKTHWALVQGDYNPGWHFTTKENEKPKYWVGIKSLESERAGRGIKVTVFNLKSGEKIEFIDRDDNFNTGYVELGKIDGIDFGNNKHATRWRDEDKLQYWVDNTGVPKEYHEFKNDPEEILDNLLNSKENMEILDSYGRNVHLKMIKGAKEMDKSLGDLSEHLK